LKGVPRDFQGGIRNVIKNLFLYNMANSQIRCIRTPEELKSKYVQGYSLEGHLWEKRRERTTWYRSWNILRTGFLGAMIPILLPSFSASSIA